MSIRMRPLTPVIGAEAEGLDLSEPLSEEALRQLREALLTYKVLFLRNQAISTDQHVKFARCFGELEVHPFAPHMPGYPEVLAITHDENAPGMENLWHADVTWRLEPSLGSTLLCRECPAVGGDTLFADMATAYDNLPDATKQRVCGLKARHDFPGFRNALRGAGKSDAEIEELNRRFPNPQHPVIRTHPETGRQTIFVNRAFTREIVGLGPDESRELLELLWRQASKPEFQCRFHWEPNSIAFWDNRACQHYATSDYYPAKRSVERVTIVGDAPFYRPGKAGVTPDVSRFKGHIEFARMSDDFARRLM
jgi:taurine dioxygenase